MSIKKSAATGPRYFSYEMPGGWRVIKNFGNEQPVPGVFPTKDGAELRIAKLIKADERRRAMLELRTTANGQCQCVGECGRDAHTGRCEATEGGTAAGLVGARVALKAVPLNHNDDDLRPENLRMYCQLCMQTYDADRRNMDPLFDVASEQACGTT